jgi:hypothetical protein
MSNWISPPGDRFGLNVGALLAVSIVRAARHRRQESDEAILVV